MRRWMRISFSLRFLSSHFPDKQARCQSRNIFLTIVILTTCDKIMGKPRSHVNDEIDENS